MALLFAPASGAEMRAQINDRSQAFTNEISRQPTPNGLNYRNVWKSCARLRHKSHADSKKTELIYWILSSCKTSRLVPYWAISSPFYDQRGIILSRFCRSAGWLIACSNGSCNRVCDRCIHQQAINSWLHPFAPSIRYHPRPGTTAGHRF